MTVLETEWALWGVAPGSDSGYAVLACSDGRLRPPHFRKIITRFSPGTPDADTALPRVTIGTVDITRDPHIGMAIQDRAEHPAGGGMVPTRFFLFPYERLREHPVSYRDLYTALARLRLPQTGQGPPLEVTAPRLDAAAIAADLVRTGVESALTAASHLLGEEGGGRVCVTQAEQSSFEDRLRYLDAAAALLPYGYRAKLTATTWANSATRHHLRLYFARHSADPEATVLPWQRRIDLTGDRPYAQRLRHLLHDRDPAEVITRLAGETEARRFGDAEEAHHTLYRIEVRLDLRRALHSGEPSRQELRTWLGDDLDPPEAEICLRRLLPLAQGGDMELITHWLPRIAPGTGWEQWRQPLVEVLTRLLWRDEESTWPDTLPELVRALGQEADGLLADAIRARPQQPPLWRLIMAARLLLLVSEHNLAALPRVGEALDGDVSVTLALVHDIFIGGREAATADALSWAMDRLPHEVATLLAHLLGSKPRPAGPAEIGQLAGHGTSCLGLTLAILHETSRLHLMAHAFVQWLVSRGGLPPGDEHFWVDVLADLTPEDPTLQAMIDVVLATAGHRPRWMADVLPHHWQSYQEALGELWNRDWPDRGRMTLALADLLRTGSWRKTPGRADEVLTLLERLALVNVPALGAAIATGLSLAGDLSRDPLARRWLAQWTPKNDLWSADEAASVPMPRMQQAEAVLDVLMSALADGATAREAGDRLAHSGLLSSTEAAMTVVALLPGRVTRQTGGRAAREWSEMLVEYICRGRFGPDLAAEFPALWLNELLDGIRERIWSISHLAAHSKGLLTEPGNVTAIESSGEALRALAARDTSVPPGRRPEKQPRQSARGRWRAGESDRDSER